MKTKLTYVGRVISTKHKLLYKYIDELGDSNLFSKPIIACSIGSIVECEKTDVGVKSPYSLVGKHEDKSDVSIWVQQDWANKKQMDVDREMKKVPKTKYDEIVYDLNQIIRSLPRGQRLLFKMKLINDLDT